MSDRDIILGVLRALPVAVLFMLGLWAALALLVAVAA